MANFIVFAGPELFAQGTNHLQVFETHGIASSMGKIMTVSSDGPYDVLRNPAVLTTQKVSNGAVIGVTREAYNSFDVSSDIDINITGATVSNVSVEPDFSRESFLLGGGAYTRKITPDIFAGIAVTHTSETMENTDSSAFTLSGTFGTDQIYRITEGREDKKTTNVVAAAGYKLLPGCSVGVQVKIEHAISEKADEEGAFSMGDSKRTLSETNSEALSPIIVLGFLYRDGFQEAGCVLTSGKYSWQKIDYKTKYRDLNTPSNNADFDESTKMEGKYMEAPGIVAGYYAQLNSYIGFAAEAGLMVPIKYSEQQLSFMDENGIHTGYVDKENTIKKKFTYMINGGIRLSPSEDITIALGGGYRMLASEESESEISITSYNSTGKTSIDFIGYLATIGLSAKVLESSRIMLSLDMIFFDMSAIANNSTVIGATVLKMKMTQDIVGLFFNTGVAYVQYF